VLDKGCLVYVQGKEEPMRGLLWIEDFDKIFIWKRAFTEFINFIGDKEGHKKKNIITKLIVLWATTKQYEMYLRFIHHAIFDVIFDDPNKYCQPMRELYRVFPKELERERDLICMFLEGDHAYKYRFQDIVSELNQPAFKKNPLKETIRLVEILKSREVYGKTMWHKWDAMKKVIIIAYWGLKIFKPKLFKTLLKMVGDLNINEIKPSKEDLYWMNLQDSYNFRGLDFNYRMLINKQKYAV